MSDRREEGPLGDRARQADNQRVEAILRRRERERLEKLMRVPEFVEWLGGHAEPFLLGNLATTNGGDIQHWLGKRAVVLAMLRDFAIIAPSFTERVLAARRTMLSEVRNNSTPSEPPPEA